jgi:hypothetical protein
MAKKLSLLLTAVAVLAFAAPSFAAAETGLTMPEGTLVPTGTIITGTSMGVVKTTSEKLGTIECQNVMVEAKVTANSGTTVKAEEGGTSTATTCTRAGASVSVENIHLTELHTEGGGTGTASASFDVKLSEKLTCHFVGTNDVGTYSGNTINVEKGKLTVTPASCGESASLDGDFTLSTQGKPTTEPVILM